MIKQVGITENKTDQNNRTNQSKCLELIECGNVGTANLSAAIKVKLIHSRVEL